MTLDRWSLIASRSEEVKTLLQELMKQLGVDEALAASISKPFVSSWAYFITRVCESILGLTPINQLEGEEAADESSFQAIEGVSDEISKNIFKIIPGQLYTYCIKEIAKFTGESESGAILLKLISECVMPSDPTLAKVLAGCCDYLLAEHLELASNGYRDNHGYSVTAGIGTDHEDVLAVKEAKAWKAMLDNKSSEESAETTSDDAEEVDEDKLRQILKDRYGSISWYYVSQAVDNDEELGKFWKMLGFELTLNTKFEKTESEDEDPFGARSSMRDFYKKVRATRRELFIQYGGTGMALREELASKLTPLAHQDIYAFAMKLPVVDKLGNAPDEDDYSWDSSVTELLGKIRDSSDGGSVDIDFGETVFGQGASLFQVLAALVYQCHTGAIGKINCTGSPPEGEGVEMLSILADLFPNHFSLDELELECEDFKLFDERMSFQQGNRTLIALTLSGQLPTFAVIMPSLAEDVNDSYISNSCSGLNDEDQLGMVSFADLFLSLSNNCGVAQH
jgi:hypothetical protein